MAAKTAVRASHIIAYDGQGHRHLKDGVVVYEGNTIVYVGKEYAEPVARTIDATGKVVTPGFINTHAHLAGSPLDKSFIEDRGNPQFYMSGLFEYLPVRGGAMMAEDARAIYVGTALRSTAGSYANIVAFTLADGRAFQISLTRPLEGRASFDLLLEQQRAMVAAFAP